MFFAHITMFRKRKVIYRFFFRSTHHGALVMSGRLQSWTQSVPMLTFFFQLFLNQVRDQVIKSIFNLTLSAGVRCHERIKRIDKCDDIRLILEELKRNNCPIDDVTPNGKTNLVIIFRRKCNHFFVSF